MSRHWPRARIMRAMRARVQAHAENGVMTKTTNADPAHPTLKPATRLVVGGRDPAANHGFVNPPVHHVSTVLYPTAEDFLARRARYLYGRRGTPALRFCPPGSRRFRPPCWRCSTPAITCW